MVLSLGIYELAFFHLVSHAMFKSLLFLCAGFYIHASSDSQDVRLLGKLTESFPLVGVYFTGCSLSLCGFPFLSGFYSKDLILESYFTSEMNMLIYVMAFLGTLFTISYSVRLVFYIYMNKRMSQLVGGYGLDMFILTPMSLLFVVSVLTGAAFS